MSLLLEALKALADRGAPELGPPSDSPTEQSAPRTVAASSAVAAPDEASSSAVAPNEVASGAPAAEIARQAAARLATAADAVAESLAEAASEPENWSHVWRQAVQPGTAETLPAESGAVASHAPAAAAREDAAASEQNEMAEQNEIGEHNEIGEQMKYIFAPWFAAHGLVAEDEPLAVADEAASLAEPFPEESSPSESSPNESSPSEALLLEATREEALPEEAASPLVSLSDASSMETSSAAASSPEATLEPEPEQEPACAAPFRAEEPAAAPEDPPSSATAIEATATYPTLAGPPPFIAPPEPTRLAPESLAPEDDPTWELYDRSSSAASVWKPAPAAPASTSVAHAIAKLPIAAPPPPTPTASSITIASPTPTASSITIASPIPTAAAEPAPPTSPGELRVSEPYLRLANRLLQSLRAARPQAIVLAAADEASTQAIDVAQLAKALTIAEESRTLVVQGHAGRPELGRRLGLEPERHPRWDAAAGGELSSRILCSSQRQLDLLPFEHLPRATEQAIDPLLLARCKRHYPLVLIDVGVVTGELAQRLAPQGDAAIIVAALRHTSRERAVQGVSLLRRLGVRAAGCVLIEARSA